MEKNCIRDIVMIIIYRPVSRSGFFPSCENFWTLEQSHILLSHFTLMHSEYVTWKSTSEIDKKNKKTTTHTAQGQQHTLSATQMNKGLDKEQ